ncbi:MAG: primosomal protein N' [Fibrobacter sp.]|nr:primosomal protein N' [Fibrobacter sp.]
MGKKMPQTMIPEAIHAIRAAENFSQFAEVYIPGSRYEFTYGVKDTSVRRGSVVWVALQKRSVLALVAKVHTSEPVFKVKEAVAHPSGFCFSERYMETLEWVSRYYLSPPGVTLSAFFPADLRKYLDVLYSGQSNETAKSEKTEREKKERPPLTKAQSDVLASLESKLEQKGFRGVLLHGVTGSGKTRIYQELVQRALAQGLKILILVPEIGLTPQMRKRFSDFLNVPVHVMHSALSVKKKRECWLALMKGDVRVVLGTRSAILLPFDFDLVILDEEHDASYKQHSPAPRYHSRELAFHIAHRYGAFVLLGSATPSLETYENARSGNLGYSELTERATRMKLPEVRMIDMREERKKIPSGLLLSSKLREALTDCIQRGKQAIILFNRRGFSKLRVCTECGNTLYCRHCHVPLVFHKQHRGFLCHYCGTLYPKEMPCECGSPEYELLGGAIEMLEEEIKEWIPAARVVRMDRDTTQNIGSAEKILNAFRAEEYSVLLGTQMVAKGHDFPKVQLVGIVGADTGAGVPDFRGNERLFQLLSQTAGRAGRAEEGGEVWIQTENPENPVMRFALAHDYKNFAAAELEERNFAGYPPFCKLLRIELGSSKQDLLGPAAENLRTKLNEIPGIRVLGPVEAFIPRVQNVYWVQFLIKGTTLTALRAALNSLWKDPEKWGIPPAVEIKADVDPC